MTRNLISRIFTLKFTPLEFETVVRRAFNGEGRVKIYSVGV